MTTCKNCSQPIRPARFGFDSDVHSLGYCSRRCRRQYQDAQAYAERDELRLENARLRKELAELRKRAKK